MKYFLHDTTSFNDEKITELYINFGYEGLGLFYTLLEKIAQQEKPIKTSVLKHQLNVGKKLDKCWQFMEEIELISSSNGETFNEQLLEFSQKYQIKKEKTRKKVAEWREKQLLNKDVTSYETVSNTPKVKLSKVKEIKEEIENSQSWLENLLMKRRIDLSKGQIYLGTFLDLQEDLIGEGNGLNRDVEDIQNHFVKWLDTELKKEQPKKDKPFKYVP